MRIVLRPISAGAAEAIRAGRPPDDVQVAADYPTEFSTEVAERVVAGAPLGPFFMHRAEDDVVVGEIGGSMTGAGTAEIGYAVVRSCWGQGHATDAVRAIVGRARELGGIERVVAHAPLDRPGSGRVLQKAGFSVTSEHDAVHDGVAMRVQRWELAL